MSENKWSKSSPSWGSAYRVQRNAYAWQVAMVLTGGRMVCPACESPMTLDNAEVDRVRPALDYRPTNVVYLCIACNQGRSVLQSAGKDWAGLDAYADAVAAASASVSVMTITAARKWWATIPRKAQTRSRWA